MGIIMLLFFIVLFSIAIVLLSIYGVFYLIVQFQLKALEKTYIRIVLIGCAFCMKLNIKKRDEFLEKFGLEYSEEHEVDKEFEKKYEDFSIDEIREYYILDYKKFLRKYKKSFKFIRIEFQEIYDMLDEINREFILLEDEE